MIKILSIYENPTKLEMLEIKKMVWMEYTSASTNVWKKWAGHPYVGATVHT